MKDLKRYATYAGPITITIIILILVIVSSIFHWESKTITKEEFDAMKARRDLTVDTTLPTKKMPSQNFTIIDNKVVPLTQLTPEQLEVQKKAGCVACHNF